MFYADKRKPLVGDFDLGSKEQREAIETHYASLSVWDEVERQWRKRGRSSTASAFDSGVSLFSQLKAS
ncbi:MAG TPA: hypothetical protein VEZ11_13515 [Thermoanaerobaculia bacterium]|nr:hypothetical protein [Thermoanaerobaculia bacterium]